METKPDTQPTRPPDVPEAIIPAPPVDPRRPPRIVRRVPRKERKIGWGSALFIAGGISLLILLIGLVLLLIFAPEYTDPYIPGRLETRTQEAIAFAATDNAFATRDADVATAQGQAAEAAFDAAQTGTAVAVAATALNRIETADALAIAGTESVIEQTATGAAIAFEATQTAAAQAARSTDLAATGAALEAQFTATTLSLNATRSALQPLPLATQPNTDAAVALPTSEGSLLDQLRAADASLLFTDEFTGQIDPAWTAQGGWFAINDRATAPVCGAVLTVGSRSWENVAFEVDFTNPGAQMAILGGYGDAGRLYVNFGLSGALWWLVEGAPPITDETQFEVYDTSRDNRARVEFGDGTVRVRMNGELIAERAVDETLHGPFGLFTCPAGNTIPTFDNVVIEALP